MFWMNFMHSCLFQYKRDSTVYNLGFPNTVQLKTFVCDDIQKQLYPRSLCVLFGLVFMKNLYFIYSDTF